MKKTGRRRRIAGKKGGVQKWKWFVCLMVLMLLSGYLFLYANSVMKPAITAMAKLKAKSMVTLVVNQSVQEKFSQDIDVSRLLDVKLDDQGKVAMVRSDTVEMTRIASDLNDIILRKFKELEPTVIKVPLGSVLGSEILSQFGPSVHLKIYPLGTSKVDFKTDFESTGINQSHYKIYLEVHSQAEVVAPFLDHQIKTSTVVPIGEMVVVGDTPQTYINVPEDRALEALD